jgi:hypothetical protein
MQPTTQLRVYPRGLLQKRDTKLLPLGVRKVATFSALALITYRRQRQVTASNTTGGSRQVRVEQHILPPRRNAAVTIIVMSYETGQKEAVTDGSESH